ncbi:MAG TPA: NAD(P)/FAD-dependent oxidoreductase [Verrucomicrobiae bacterium]|jgi:protoporphyrinogen oxidase|nr:NAD(P)/FAD-dependent oxidoreductase [Verrucomicrobiae bacterium]
MSTPKALILGAGPAGLSAAHELSNHGVSCHVVDRHTQVGGLCRTLDFEGYRFDIGGHRFLSRSVEVNDLWKNVLGQELLTKSRKSRIYFRGQFYDYPLHPWKTLQKLGPVEAARCIASYLGAQLSGGTDSGSFENWMIRRFGRRLYENFFKSYTEKVWGIPCSRLSSDWAAQRIQELSLQKAIHQAFFSDRERKIKTLSDRFYYPRLGPGQFCERLKAICETKHVNFHLEREIAEVQTQGRRVRSVISASGGRKENHEADYFLSSIPLPVLVEKLSPRPPKEILEAAASLSFRSFISVNLIFNSPDLFDDHWIYVHSPDVKAGRVQNYKNWSREMVPDDQTTSLGVEYFVFEGDELWNKSDEALIRFAADELAVLGLADKSRLVKGFVAKIPKAYPVYGPGYKNSVRILRDYLAGFENLQVMGRAGLFRYNNSDHAILTGLFAARNVLGEGHDLWTVDPDRHFVAALD